MVKYNKEQLLEFQDEFLNPQPQILEAFAQLVELVKEHAAAEYEKQKEHHGVTVTLVDERGNEDCTII